MKMKSFLELLTLSSNLYVLSKDADTMDKLRSYSEMGKDKINSFVNEKIKDSEGNELEFVDKLVVKLHEAKESLEEKIESAVAEMYHKMNIAHTDQIEKLDAKMESLTKELSLAKSRIKKLEKK